MFKRIGLFLITNALVIITISVIMNILGVGHYINESGLDYTSLLIFCGIWGMAGSFISLALSKFIAKKSMGVKVISPSKATGTEAEIVQMVHRLARSAKLPKMPEVGIYESPEVNAFATGPTRSNSLVAVSTGLLNHMNRAEVEGVLGHEVAHVANGDMVTMTLLQGIINAFVMFLSRVLAFAISNFLRDEEGGGISYALHFVFVIVFDIVFTMLGSIVVAAFSRYREFHADKGSAGLTGKEKMIAALQKLKSYSERIDTNSAPAMNAFKISGKPKWMQLFSTHPTLEDRIRRLQKS